MKIYAKQVPPEYQESPLFWDDSTLEGIYIGGNRRLKSHGFEEIDALHVGMAEAAGDLYQAKKGRLPGFSFADTLRELIPRESGDYTRAERLTWRDILDDESALYCHRKYEKFCQALELLTGKKWKFYTLRGCCQSDWQYCIYPADEWNAANLERLEAEYFNTGSEWIVHEDENAPETPEDIDGYSVYCTGWNDDMIRQEIAEAAGGAPEDVTLYKFTGYARRAEYEEVRA
jgi:hypothetical protein